MERDPETLLILLAIVLLIPTAMVLIFLGVMYFTGLF